VVTTVVSLLLIRSGTAVGDFVFVKNAKNTTAQVDRETVKNLFTGKTKNWTGGLEVVPISRPPAAPSSSGCARMSWGTVELVLSKIKQQVFKGEMKKPSVANSAQECIAAVDKEAGGICVVDAAATKSPCDRDHPAVLGEIALLATQDLLERGGRRGRAHSGAPASVGVPTQAASRSADRVSP